MTGEQIREITAARLAEWAELAAGDHATPAVLVCIGHDHRRGAISVMTTEGVSDPGVVALLRQAIVAIRTGTARVAGGGNPKGGET